MRKKMILNGKSVEISADVDNPVRGIYTQEEFDVLTDDQKASGTYFVDDGQSGGSSLEVYDGQERVIGTWFGKPLYRKVYTGTAKFEKTSNITIIETGFGSSKNFKRGLGNITAQYASSNYYTYNMPTSACNTSVSRYINVYIDNNKNLCIDIIWDANTIAPAPFELAVEYTKTTDQEVSA